MLGGFEVPHFLPLATELRQWTDRKQRVEVPLFPGYIFVRIDPNSHMRLQALRPSGAVNFVASSQGPLPIPDDEIETLRLALSSGLPCSSRPLLQQGDRVRVVRGPLTGIEGIFLRANQQRRLVISIEMIQRSVAVTLGEQDVVTVYGDTSGAKQCA
jgi:transcription antitermination factor NusG